MPLLNFSFTGRYVPDDPSEWMMAETTIGHYVTRTGENVKRGRSLGSYSPRVETSQIELLLS
jgi:hypothetical protein